MYPCGKGGHQSSGPCQAENAQQVEGGDPVLHSLLVGPEVSAVSSSRLPNTRDMDIMG